MNNVHEEELLNHASKLDAVVNANGEITRLAISVVEEENNAATVELLKRISELGKSQSRQTLTIAKAVKDSVIKYHGYLRVKEICGQDTKNSNTEAEKSLSQLLEELNSLVGLSNVKKKVNDLIAYHHVRMLREQAGLKSQGTTLHLAFTGNPGTGKTTVARIIGHIYKQLGLLSKGQFVEVSRTDLIAGYQGQTALKVKAVIESAKGGVLFIDEAYSLTENDHSDSYGRECLTELTKALEDYRDDLVVIVAGYTEPMKQFFESNPGLKSRFNTFIEFDDYSASELFGIFMKMCKDNHYSISSTGSARLQQMFDEALRNKTNEFANGRFVRNTYEDLVMNHAGRVNRILHPSRQDLMEIKAEDIHTEFENE